MECEPLKNYDVLIFDFDGVIINSNIVKQKGFEYASSSYGSKVKARMDEIQSVQGGHSRYDKFKILSEFVVRNSGGNEAEVFSDLVEKFELYTREWMLQCEIASEIFEIRDVYPKKKIYVVSSSDQHELRNLIKQRELSRCFDGVFGSPTSKIENIIFHIGSEIDFSRSSVVLVGDSEVDFNAAKECKFDFIYCSGWSASGEVVCWSRMTTYRIEHVRDLLPKQYDT